MTRKWCINYFHYYFRSQELKHSNAFNQCCWNIYDVIEHMGMIVSWKQLLALNDLKKKHINLFYFQCACLGWSAEWHLSHCGDYDWLRHFHFPKVCFAVLGSCGTLPPNLDCLWRVIYSWWDQHFNSYFILFSTQFCCYIRNLIFFLVM